MRPTSRAAGRARATGTTRCRAHGTRSTGTSSFGYRSIPSGRASCTTKRCPRSISRAPSSARCAGRSSARCTSRGRSSGSSERGTRCRRIRVRVVERSGAATDEELVWRSGELVAKRAAPPHADEEASPRWNGKRADRVERLTEELCERSNQCVARRGVDHFQGQAVELVDDADGGSRQPDVCRERLSRHCGRGELVDITGRVDRFATNGIAHRVRRGRAFRSAVDGNHTERVWPNESVHAPAGGVVTEPEKAVGLIHGDTDLSARGHAEGTRKVVAVEGRHQAVTCHAIEHAQVRVQEIRPGGVDDDAQVLAGCGADRVFIPVSGAIDGFRRHRIHRHPRAAPSDSTAKRYGPRSESASDQPAPLTSISYQPVAGRSTRSVWWSPSAAADVPLNTIE